MNERSLPRLVSLLSAVLLAVSLMTAAARAGDPPIRKGKVISSTNTRTYTYIQARDDEGKEFWIVTSHIKVAPGAAVEVLQGTHKGRVESRGLGKVLEDLYDCAVLKVDDKEFGLMRVHDSHEIQ